MRAYALSTVLFLSTAVVQAAPSGHIAFLKDNAAYVASAATGQAVRLPQSSGAALVEMSPRDGSTAYFVTPSGTRPTGETQYYYGRISRPPYRTVTALPAPLNRAK